jgi:hypothetical protein
MLWLPTTIQYSGVSVLSAIKRKHVGGMIRFGSAGRDQGSITWLSMGHDLYRTPSDAWVGSVSCNNWDMSHTPKNEAWICLDFPLKE